MAARRCMTTNPYESPQTTSTLSAVEPKPVWDEIEIEYELTIEDYIEFNVHHLQNAPAQRRAYLRASVILVTFILLADLGMLLFRSQIRPLREFDFLFHGAIGVALLIGVGIRLILDRKGRRRTWIHTRMVRNALKGGDYSNIIGRRRCRVTKDFLENFAAQWESKWRLQCIQRIEVTPNYGFVYVTPNQAIIWPVRAFLSPDHFATFVANLEGHTGKLAQRMKS
jgi:hypothetical protein